MLRRSAHLLRIARGPALINFVVNAIIGLALFGHRAVVPWTDEGSVGADLLLGGFIVSAITAWASTARLQRDAEAGLVAGLSPKNPVRFLLPGNRLLRAALVAFVVTIALLITLIPPLDAAMPAGVSGLGAAAFKGVSSAIAATLAIVISGWRALVGAPDRTAELQAQQQIALPADAVRLEPIAIACLAGTSEDHASSVAPTWRLSVEGDVSIAQVEEAFARVAQAAPICRSIVRAVDALPGYAKEYVWTPVPWTADKPAIPVDVFDAPFADVCHQAINNHLDLFEVGPMRVSAVRSDGRLHLFVQQHHGIADGRAYIAVLQAWSQALTDVRVGRPSALPPMTSRPEREAFGRSDAALGKATRRGTLRYLRESFARKTRPLERLPWNTTSAKTHGDNATVHVTIDDALFEHWRPIRKEWNVGVNAILTGAYVRAMHRQNPQVVPLTCELVAETRPRDGSYVSLANHLSVLFSSMDATALRSLQTVAQAVHSQIRAEVDDDAIAERALFRGFAARNLPLDALRPRMLDDVQMQTHMGFSNLTALDFQVLGDGLPLDAGGWRVDDIRVSTPTLPPHAIVLTAIRYAGKITFNFNFAVDVVEESYVRELTTFFIDELASLGTPVEAETECAI